MRSVVEPLEGNKVKLSITVEADEFESAIEKAWKEIAREVRIPGFRAGKVPRKVLESRIDKGYARSEAINQALPEYYVAALREHDVDVIAQPEIDITSGEEEGDVEFDAVVEVRPEITVSGYQSLTIEVPSPHPSDDDIADQIDRIRGQYGEIVPVERPAASGDYVLVDILGSRDGEPVDGLTADEYLYEVGAGTITAELDDQLRGLKAGEEIEFDAPHPDPDDADPVHYAVKVHEVKERVLPELDDEWVAEATEFESVHDLRDDVISRTTKVRRAQAGMALQSKIGDALAELVTDEVPEALVGSEMRARLEDLVHRLSHQGISLDTYLQVTGTAPESFTDDLRQTAVTASKVDLALRAVAVAEAIEALEEDLEEEYAAVAERVDEDADTVREQLTEAGHIPALRADISKRKALEWLTETVTIVDEDGNPVSFAELAIVEVDDDDSSDDDNTDTAEAAEASTPSEEGESE